MYLVEVGSGTFRRSVSSTFPDTTRPISLTTTAMTRRGLEPGEKVNFLVGSPSTQHRSHSRRRHATHHGGLPTGCSNNNNTAGHGPLIYTRHHGSSVTFCSNGSAIGGVGALTTSSTGDTLVDASEVVGLHSTSTSGVLRPSSGYFTDDDCSTGIGRHSATSQRRRQTGNRSSVMTSSSPVSSVDVGGGERSTTSIVVLDDSELKRQQYVLITSRALHGQWARILFGAWSFLARAWLYFAHRC